MEDKQFVLSPELAFRLAAIDIGTNSIRLTVAEPLRGGSYRILDEEKDMTRLGESLARTGVLDDTAVIKSLAALRRMKQIAEGFHVSQLRTIATCAVREAMNGEDFRRRAREELGLDIEIISAKEEALLAFSSVQRSFDLNGKNVAVVDIGGGSTEIVLALGNMVEAIYTTQLGAVRLSELHGYGSNANGTQEDFTGLVEGIDRHLRKTTKNPVFVPHLLYGSGGTFTALASMVMAAKGQMGLPVRGYQVTRAEVRHALEKLRKLPARERATAPGVSPDRADIILAGVAIVDRIMQRFEVNMLQVHNRGVRDGLILSMIDQSLGEPTEKPVDRDAAIDRMVAGCGGELKHLQHVAQLAGSMFAQLVKPLHLEAGDRALLEAAARLQDVGYLINYDQHHKHSYHLIINSRLEGFQPHELELVANVARYHRGAEPKRKHVNFRQLSARDQQRVRQMAAILRLAGGLDRSNTQQVENVLTTVEAETAELRLVAQEYPEVDVWAARRRAELFENTFGLTVDIEWAKPSDVKHAAGA